MTRAELINFLVTKMPHLSVRIVEESVKKVFEQMSMALEQGQRIEIRGFGSFTLRYRAQRRARNPKTGKEVITEGKYVPYFKPGKELKERVNEVINSQRER